MFGRILFEEFEQIVSLAGLGSQMDVGQEDRADLLHIHLSPMVEEEIAAVRVTLSMCTEWHGIISAL